MNHKPIIRIIHGLSRSGGTVICKCIGCMNRIALLSEIHPLSMDLYHPVDQAVKWHGLCSSEDGDCLKGESFAKIIASINQSAQQKGLSLVIREWSHIDFIGLPIREAEIQRGQHPIPVTHQSGIIHALSPVFQILNICIVRHPLEQLGSLLKLDKSYNIEDFFKGCKRFAEYATQTGFVRYEDFTSRPYGHIKGICDQLRLPFDQSFASKWHAYSKITGDFTATSRANKLKKIANLKGHEIPNEVKAIAHGSADYHEAISLLGYES